MRKIELRNYDVNLPGPDGSFVPKPYDVKNSLVSCLLHPALKLTGRELLLRGKLADQIEMADGSILVEEEDYRKLRQAFERIEGFTRNDMELVKRVLDAEEIKVQESDQESGARSQKKEIKGRRK